MKGHEGYLFHEELYEGPDQPFPVGVVEQSTMTCNHCSVVVVLNPARIRDRSWCWNCDRYICDPCKVVSQMVGCHSTMQKLELIQKFPDRKIMLTGETTPDLIDAAARTKPYLGVSIPPSPYGLITMGKEL